MSQIAPNTTEAQRQSFAVKLHEITETIFEMGIEDRPMTGNEYMVMMKTLKELADKCRVFQSHPISVYYENVRRRPRRVVVPKSLAEKMRDPRYKCCPHCDSFVYDLNEHQQTAKCKAIQQSKYSTKHTHKINSKFHPIHQVISRMFSHGRHNAIETETGRRIIFNADYDRWSWEEEHPHIQERSRMKQFYQKGLEYTYYFHSFHIRLAGRPQEEVENEKIMVWRKADPRWEFAEMTRLHFNENKDEPDFDYQYWW